MKQFFLTALALVLTASSASACHRGHRCQPCPAVQWQAGPSCQPQPLPVTPAPSTQATVYYVPEGQPLVMPPPESFGIQPQFSGDCPNGNCGNVRR